MLGGMARALATLVALLTPKRLWTQFSLATMFVAVKMVAVASWSFKLESVRWPSR
jgi:hypothetical protein